MHISIVMLVRTGIVLNGLIEILSVLASSMILKFDYMAELNPRLTGVFSIEQLTAELFRAPSYLRN